MLKFEENIVLDDIAKKVDDLVTGKTQEIDGKSALKRFREMVEEYGRRNDSYKKKESEYCDERCKNVQKLRDNKRLQDKNAGPPDKSYTWEENLGFLNEETTKIELLSGWMPTSTIQVPEDPEIWGNYGEHKDISSLIPEILLLNQYFLLAVCHDCFMGVELRPLIITKEMADKYEDGLGLYYTGHGNTNYVRPILEGKYEKFLESAYDDILRDLENRQNKTLAETGQGTNKKPLKPAELRAYQSYEDTVKKNPDLETDMNVYKWLEENGYDEYDLPSFATWQRHVRAGRAYYGTQKNTSRQGRIHGNSIVKSNQI